VKRLRKPMFAARPSGVPADITMYRVQTRRKFPAAGNTTGQLPSA
jgi:hypothetical protein